MKIKIIAVILVISLVINLVLFIIKKINPLIFWVTIAICALVAYKVMPRLKNN